jgi:DNA-binding transcriptional MerR regulator
MEERFYTSTEAAEITGCTRRQLQYWRDKGVVVPTVNTSGKGRNVYYSQSDLLALKVMEYLLSIGLSFEVCQATLDSLREVEPTFFTEPFSYRAMKRFMLWQRSPGNKLGLTKFDEEKAIAAIKRGQAVVPFWTEIVTRQLQEGVQAFGG